MNIYDYGAPFCLRGEMEELPPPRHGFITIGGADDFYTWNPFEPNVGYCIRS